MILLTVKINLFFLTEKLLCLSFFFEDVIAVLFISLPSRGEKNETEEEWIIIFQKKKNPLKQSFSLGYEK